MLLALVFIIIIGLICLISVPIINWKVDKDIAQREEDRSAAENRLTESLKNLCAQLGIDLSYHEELGTSAGRILYYNAGGRFIVDDARIEILKKYENTPYVLAHELGHYMAIKQRQDDSEQGTDVEAEKLCRLILSQREQDLLAIGLLCHFRGKS